MHHIVLWKWRGSGERFAYSSEHVNIVAAMVHRFVEDTRHRVICITDDATGIDPNLATTYPLWNDTSDIPNASGDSLPSCYRRLKLYDPATQAGLGIGPGDRIVSLDLDVVVTGRLDELLKTPGDFVGWELRGTHHPRVLNGSLQMFTAGQLAILWKSFNPAVSPKQANAAGYMGSDQAWLSQQLTPALDREVTGLKWPQVVSYPLQAAIQGLLPDNRLVFFHGTQKPWMALAQRRSPWITDYWRHPR